MTKRTLLISIPVVALVLNGVGYLIVTKMRTPSPGGTPDSAGRAALPGAGGDGSGRDQGRSPGPGGSEDSDDPKVKEERAMARRAAGLTALEAGDYQKALINFTEAKVLAGEKAHVDELLQVTEDLRTRPVAAPKPRPPAPPQASASRVSGHGGAVRRVAAKEETPAEVAPPSTSPAAAAPSGLLIVTTTPRGILVQVDDTPVDLTPMRTKVKPGTHRVVLVDGDRKVYETTVDVRDGATATLLKDLSAERAAAETARPSTQPPPAAAPVAKEESARMVPGTILPPPPPPAPAPAAATTRAPNGTATAAATSENGTLDISSPGLYGVVWINGRPRGYPPLVVQGLPAGATKVEVRVNGIQKRSSTVMVKAGLTTSVKLRSQEASP